MLLALVLFFFVLYPPIMLVFRSFFSGGSGTGMRAIEGAAGPLAEAAKALAGAMPAFLNSLRAATGVTVWTTLIGGALAWLVVRTDFPYRRVVELAAVVAFIIPPYIIGLAWLQFFGRNGYFERMLRALFQFEHYNVSYYSVTAVVVVMTLHLYPLMFLSLRNALQQQDTDLEKASLLSGASRWRTFIHVTAPLMVPSVLSTGLLVFSRTLANFTVPALLALPVRREFLTTRIFSSLSALDLRLAALLSLFLVAISTLVFWSQGFVLRGNSTARSGATDRGETRHSAVKLGRRRLLVSAAVMFFLGLTVLLPLAVMLVSSFLKRWGLPLEWRYLTLGNYQALLETGGRAMRALRNSLTFGVVAATAASIIGGATAYLAHSARSKASRLLEAVAGWPMAFPNIVLAVAAILAWNRGPLHIYGGPWAIIVTYMVLFIPIIMKQVTGLVQGHDTALLHAARVSGAGPLRAFLSVTLPAILPGLKVGFLISFLVALREIPISLMLYSSGQETLGVLLFGMQSEEYGLEMTSALAILIIFLIFSGHLLIRGGTKRINYGKTTDRRLVQALWSHKGN